MQSLDELTPVQYFHNIFWKRDDYFQPFGPYHVSGGKIRQAIQLFEHKIEDIRNKYDNGVVTATSVYSPQSANIAKVAQHFNVKCISTVGGTTLDRLDKLDMMRLTTYYGSEIKIVAGHGMSPVIHARMYELAKQLNYMPIEMGELMLDNPKSIFETTANQVQNIPDDVENLIVPTGVAIQLTGILIGIQRYNKKVKNIYSVCVGPTREKKVAEYFKKVYNQEVSQFSPFKMIAHKSPYSKGYDVKVNGEYIDDIYEAKAYDWMKKNVNYLNEKTLFWLVGKRPRPEDVDHIIKEGL